MANKPKEDHKDTPTPLLWKGCGRIPCGFVRPHVVVKDTSVYGGGGTCLSIESSRRVYKYDTTGGLWVPLPISSYYTFGLVVAKGMVTTVEGTSVLSSLTTNKLCSFDEGSTEKWCHVLPPMTTGRCVCSAVAHKDHVIVVGGMGEDDFQYLDSVEVLDLNTNQWAVAAALPLPVTFMSIAVCDVTSRVYLLGGLSPNQGAVSGVISCKLPDLLASIQSKDKQEVWEKLTTNVPYVRAGCAAINGKLVLASGLDSLLRQTTNTVQVYDPQTDSWTIAGMMPAARSSCSIAVLGGSQIMLIEGYVDPNNWTRSMTTDVMATVNLEV